MPPRPGFTFPPKFYFFVFIFAFEAKTWDGGVAQRPKGVRRQRPEAENHIDLSALESIQYIDPRMNRIGTLSNVSDALAGGPAQPFTTHNKRGSELCV
jgi:hypothetical protein